MLCVESRYHTYGIISNFIPVSFNNKHSSKHNMILRTSKKPHTKKKGWSDHALNEKISHKMHIHKNTLQILTHKAYTKNKITCIQISKLISTDFKNVWWFCFVLYFYPKDFKEQAHNFLLPYYTVRKYVFCFVLFVCFVCFIFVFVF